MLVACGGGGASGWYGGLVVMVVVLVLQEHLVVDKIVDLVEQKYNDGDLPAAGVLPSGATGGKIESCTTGGYWNTQGFSPCSDLGQQKICSCKWTN